MRRRALKLGIAEIRSHSVYAAKARVSVRASGSEAQRRVPVRFASGAGYGRAECGLDRILRREFGRDRVGDGRPAKQSRDVRMNGRQAYHKDATEVGYAIRLH